MSAILSQLLTPEIMISLGVGRQVAMSSLAGDTVAERYMIKSLDAV
jgi:hypothetical protein